MVHGHCHQKVIVGMGPTTEVLSRVEGLEFRGCWIGVRGMAGSFGYEQGHYEVSQACGERVLFPAVRERRPRISSSPPASPAATRSPTSARAAARFTSPSCWRWPAPDFAGHHKPLPLRELARLEPLSCDKGKNGHRDNARNH
ncbi:MAG: hypothetical protein ACJ8GN_06320 [Longimicrobiaceae bacterium]